MKYTLKDYQNDAVADVLVNLERAKTEYERDGQESSFSLTATTGAGKTVMAAAVIEALFYGNDDFNFAPDPGAVVLWFSDNPSLNEQSRFKLMDASEKFTSSDLVIVEPPFARPKLEPGKVYFLNTAKLGKNSLLVRGHVEDDANQLHGLAEIATPDMQGWTIWETIANTINDDDLNLYMVLDEAHRGFDTKANRDKPTIVRKLVNGHAGYPPIPILWGISATIERFQDAMKEADATKDRRSYPSVVVDPARVQESGLIKDIVALKIPNETGNFDTALVREGAKKLVESSHRWAEYARTQGTSEAVKPLLILQAPDTPDFDQIGQALDVISEEFLGGLQGYNVRHVFGEHAPQRFGAWEVEWIEPESVERETKVRVLVAKNAISTGWDCPRAEVMVSFRPAKDQTHITQLLGRMVRSPLARRVPGDEMLNSVDCILPFFDRTTAGNVVKYLTGKLEEMPGTSGKKVLYDGRELLPNPNVPQAVWAKWDELPTQTLPKRGARPVKRLVALAQALAMDGIRPTALADVSRELHQVFDGFATRYADLIDKAVDEALRVDLQEIVGRRSSSTITYRDFAVRADDRAIRSAFEDAKKAFGADVAQAYVNHLAGDDDADDDGIRDAMVKTIALANVKEVREKVDQETNAIVDRLLAQTRVSRKALPDDRQQEYADILAMAVDPQTATLGRPRTRREDYATIDENGQIGIAELAPLHLMSDEDGQFPLSSLNDWERKVVYYELKRPGAVGWYRNPARAAIDSLSIAYRDAQGNYHTMHPDFVFFHEVNGEVKASIVDPHGHHLDDAVHKLKALADFAERYGAHFHRIEAVAELPNGVMYVLDMTIPQVRDAVRNEERPAIEFYQADFAVMYEA